MNSKVKVEVEISEESHRTLRILSAILRRSESEILTKIIETSLPSLGMFIYNLLESLAAHFNTTPQSLISKLLQTETEQKEEENKAAALLNELREVKCMNISKAIMKYNREVIEALLREGKIERKGVEICIKE